MSLSEQRVREIVQEELARGKVTRFSFGDRVKYVGEHHYSYEYQGVGIVVNELDNDGDVKVHFASGDFLYLKPRDLVLAG